MIIDVHYIPYFFLFIDFFLFIGYKAFFQFLQLFVGLLLIANFDVMYNTL